MSARTSVPTLQSGQPDVDAFGEAVKANVDQLTGQAPNSSPLLMLPTDGTATLAQAVTLLNQIVARMQGT